MHNNEGPIYRISPALISLFRSYRVSDHTYSLVDLKCSIYIAIIDILRVARCVKWLCLLYHTAEILKEPRGKAVRFVEDDSSSAYGYEGLLGERVGENRVDQSLIGGRSGRGRCGCSGSVRLCVGGITIRTPAVGWSMRVWLRSECFKAMSEKWLKNKGDRVRYEVSEVQTLFCGFSGQSDEFVQDSMRQAG
ncbi:hypothetical protein Tco_0059804 [Tanacetum coccineum]